MRPVRRLSRGLHLTGVAISLLLMVALMAGAGWSQERPLPPAPPVTAPAPDPSEPDLPRSIREAYERAEQFGEPPPPAPPPAEAPVGTYSLWQDPVHYIGIAGGLVALLALLSGGWIGLVLSRRRGREHVRNRRQWRQWHMSLGLAAVLLALLHVVLRYSQMGAIPPIFGPAKLALLSFLLVGVSGMLWFRPPRSLARHWRIFAWTHQAAVVATMVFLVWHSVAEWLFYAGMD